MTDDEIILRPETLEPFLTEVFEKAGLSKDDACFISRTFVQTHLWGVDSHGIVRVPIYVKRLRVGAINPRPNITRLKGSKSLEIIDGDNGHGFIVGREAMRRAIHLAGEYNVGMVGVVRSNHFGAAGIYARMAADEGMIGIAMTNVGPLVVMPGCSRPVVGNNPIAFAIPTFGPFPIVLDIATSAVAGGKLLMASQRGEKIPLDWATDKEGRATDDPKKAFDGFFFPAGGHKGFGLALIIDILCGVITGGAFLDQVRGMYKYPNDPSSVGHFVIAMNLSSVMDPEEMKERMASFYRMIKATPMWDHSKEVLLPGEIEYRAFLERKKTGIPLPNKLYQELIALGQEMGIESPLE